jgi:acetyl-CoA carboxylase biotin carboxyl carrier protein
MSVDPDKLRALLDVLIEKDITEFEHETETERLRVVRGVVHSVVAHAAHGAGHAAAALPSQGIAPTVPLESGDIVEVTSPFIGTFYRAPSPDAPMFVDIGSVVKANQTLCIVEAMKLMNEIESEVAGTVVEICVQNGKAVEYGQKLFRIKKA